MKKLQNFIILLVLSPFVSIITNAQGVKISNNSGSPHSSAIFEVESTTQGLLIPRMLTSERKSISNPSAGLLVFDTDLNSFFIYGKSKWTDLSMSSEIWSQTATDVYLTNSTQNIGIGTKTPSSKFVIQADGTKLDDDILFEVKDKTGKTIMAVTSLGIRMYVSNPTKSGKGISGGFAVGKYGSAKGLGDLLVVDSESTNIYVNEGGKGISGGFAVGKYGSAKGVGDMLVVTTDSTRVYTESAAGISGGFAVGKYGSAKEKYYKYFYTNSDSTRVYTDETVKGISGGFAVGKYGSAKAKSDRYIQITHNNTFIGESAGFNTLPSTGTNNVFIGTNAGQLNTTGSGNVFIGNNAGSTVASSNQLYIDNASSSSDVALIYGDFTSKDVNLNGRLRFNAGIGNTITMPTSRGTANHVLTTNGSGNTNWINVNSLVTFPSNEPRLVITEEQEYVIEETDITTLVVKSFDEGSPVIIRIPDTNENDGREIIIKNFMQGTNELKEVLIKSISGELIDGQNEKTVYIDESYTIQASASDNSWYIIGKSTP